MIGKTIIFFSFVCIVFVFCATEAVDKNIAKIAQNKTIRDKFKKAKKAKKAESDNSMGSKIDQMMPLPRFPLTTYPQQIIFEEVDYNLLPPGLNETYNAEYNEDCYFLHTKCIRDQTNFAEACAYHLKHGWLNFATYCDIDLQNCIERVEKGVGIYGQELGDGDFKFQGDGHDCSGNQ